MDCIDIVCFKALWECIKFSDTLLAEAESSHVRPLAAYREQRVVQGHLAMRPGGDWLTQERFSSQTSAPTSVQPQLPHRHSHTHTHTQACTQHRHTQHRHTYTYTRTHTHTHNTQHTHLHIHNAETHTHNTHRQHTPSTVLLLFMHRFLHSVPVTMGTVKCQATQIKMLVLAFTRYLSETITGERHERQTEAGRCKNKR